MDTSSLVDAVVAGAVTLKPVAEIVGTEVVKEITKDCYKAFKLALGSVFGKKAEGAIEAVEQDPNSADAQKRLVEAVSGVPPEYEDDIREKLDTFLAALRDDPAASKSAEAVAKIKVDVDAQGNVAFKHVEGATEIDIKAKAGQDFEFSNVTMRPGRNLGN